MDTPELLASLADWVGTGGLRPLDLAFTQFIHQRTPEQDPLVLLAIALTCERSGRGHVCLDLWGVVRAFAAEDQAAAPDSDWIPAPPALRALMVRFSPQEWAERLAASAAVEDLRQHRPSPSCLLEPQAEGEARPLVLGGIPERPLLYLRRYWLYEQQVLRGIQARLEQPADTLLDAELLRDWLAQLFADDPPDAPPWQRIACALAARAHFAVITGGPGTGKTTTVARLLALLQGLALGCGCLPLSIRLAAPTGKAAARLNEALATSVSRLPYDRLPLGEALRAAIPIEAQTLHRLLGARPDSGRLRYDRRRPLPADVVVVDEASMIDVERMAALLEALRPQARLFLIGDKDQLASVEAGAVLGGLCQRAQAGHYTPQTAAWIERVTGARLPGHLIDPQGRPLDQAIAVLRSSFRFSAQGGIGALARLVKLGESQGETPERSSAGAKDRASDPLPALEHLFQAAQTAPQDSGSIRRILLRNERDPQLDALLRAGYWQGLGPDPSAGTPSGYLAVLQGLRPADNAEPAAFDHWARAVLKAHSAFQLLTPVRQGPWGVEGLNRRIQRLLGQGPDAPLAGAGERLWFEGRPVMVTRNDYALGLMNGDIGIALRAPAGPSSASTASRMGLRVAFLSPQGTSIRWIPATRLQAVETVFAMTVHKSQGSEFTHVALVLPDADTPVLTCELLYTGITRARSSLTLIYCDEAVLRAALHRQIERFSGLALALHRGEQGMPCAPYRL
ncbi:exodeoxyribonuclease V subunit alpha [Caldichromatium japonicum]|uniref:RecBCD enzyme subunit RecD n=1 Tax=Caldichromatium japonicum TaxID=2699430 RepID=A0A6G7VEA5_9GAMM|nr:exodeoxyribonuclease V subunit alpha [Caldichromatium japonicum]QIK38351.1 exodeoxyribonuclease V subunit alpha [Caldichromatium japonicum]